MIGNELLLGPTATILDALSTKYSTAARAKDGHKFFVRSPRGSALGMSPHISGAVDAADAVYNDGASGIVDYVKYRAPGVRAVRKHLGFEDTAKRPSSNRKEKPQGFGAIRLRGRQKKRSSNDKLLPPWMRDF